MKKNYFFSIVALLTVSLGSMQGQVVNGTFENIKDNGLISNWGMNFFTPITIDAETGETTQDFITFGCWPGFVFPSWDANHGQHAMQMTNGLNVTTNTIIPAKSILFNDPKQDIPGWNPGIPVDLSDQVAMLGFDYKFTRMGNDIAEAELVVFGTDGQELGRATVDISQTNTQYQYLYEPVQFTSFGIPASIQVSFSMAKEGSVPAFGSTLIVDDVIVSYAALANDEFQSTQFIVYPTVASSEINIVKGSTAPSGNYNFTITNMEGKTVSNQSIQLSDNNPFTVDVSQLSKGIYFISSKGFSTKFMKQ
ncbi:T9SS type A sorting domain-containing protein [Flavobacterium sp.]|uniref:T9SS type A sorting domain-containing protein n=1 Tax=Flavobacterium sp. TaxID=239 RepID=UPI00286CBD3F|nr:T9SS type A sorting domain-containing protein [Flavobacterium sp.]